MARIAHFDCFSGISGDMVLSAVIAAGVEADAIRTALDSLGLPITLEVETVKRCGLAATKATIVAPDEENYRFLPDIEAIIARSSLSSRQQAMASAIFGRLARAEAVAHGMPVEKVHFHEVGALDSIADILGAAVGLDLLGVERFTSSPVPTGSGNVTCAHGLMPIPTPATAELLKGIPLAASTVKAELTTPTGAAILTSVVTEFGSMPAMTIESIGLGAGGRDLMDQPNILRIFVGTSEYSGSYESEESDKVWVLETNLDDIPAEIVGYCFERLFEAGAMDVFAMPIQMKKNRPALVLSVITSSQKIGELESIIFRETATFGIRRYEAHRSKLQRKRIELETRWGIVAGKSGWRVNGLEVIAPEYEDCARLARQFDIPLRAIYASIRS